MTGLHAGLAVPEELPLRRHQSWWWDASIVSLLVAISVFALSRTDADPDLWGHLRFGQDFWHTGYVVRPDPYSYLTAGQLWVNHEWLAEATFYLAYAGGGAPALIAVKLALDLTIGVLLYWHLRRRGMSVLGAGLLLVYGALLIIPGVSPIRPQIFTYLLFTTLLVLIYHFEREARRGMWIAPLLFALWANLHGGFLAGVGILLVWCLTHVLRLLRGNGWRDRSSLAAARTVLVVTGASVLGTLLNPYGAKLWIFLRAAMAPRPEIVEWNSLAIMSPPGIIYVGLLAAGSAGFLFSRRERSPIDVALFASTALLPTAAIRHLPLCAISTLLMAGEHIGDAFDRWMSSRWPRSQVPARLTLRPGLTALFGAGAIVLLLMSVPHFRCIEVDTRQFPVQAIQLLKQSAARGSLIVFFNWGEYALWHLGPNIKVSMDGRRETIYPANVYAENNRFEGGVGEWDALLRNHPADFALVSKGFPVVNLMKREPGWRLAYEDTFSALFVRQGAPLTRPLPSRSSRPGGAPDPRSCFP